MRRFFPLALALLYFSIVAVTLHAQPNNSKPVITGQTPSPLSTAQGAPITIQLANLIVEDADPSPVYPEGFTLDVSNGKDYKVSGATVTPDPGFSGMLSVQVSVSDGKQKSDKFDLQIEVIKTQNEPPVITGQQGLTMDQGGSLAIELGHLKVSDPDNNYPAGFNLTVFSGPDYTFNGTTVTPAADFSGKLTVPVSVNDGQNESNRFDLKIDVKKKPNAAPQITGQQPLTMDQGGTLTIELGHLFVTDPDNTYPTGFSLKIFDGKDYTFNGTTVAPSANFSGELTVRVSVSDGEKESNRFDLKIDVIKKQNTAPEITGQQALTINQGGSVSLELSHLIVTDPDNTYPGGFTLKIYPGTNYSITGTTITPAADFSGKLTVPVSVNDGQNESNRFDLKIDVKKKQNEAPQITGQQPLSVDQGGTLTIEFGHLLVTDPDNTYPTDFTLKLFGGKDYTFNGSTVTPAGNFTGQLTVRVSVNDGEKESNRFDLKIDVIKKANVAPQITGQQVLSINEGANLTLQLSHLTVSDPDNSYPTGFTLKVFPGTNYSFSGTTISPSVDFSGQLTVPVTVNDGQNESNRFDLKVDVIKKQNVAPQITGQQALSINEGANLTLQLSHLSVTDPDNSFPAGFTLKVFPGTNYSFSGTTITPSADFSGQLTVPVTVNDGQNESNRFDVKIDVIKNQNGAPQITGQQALSINQGADLTVELSHLIVTDPDNSYPTGFTLKILAGGNYTVSGNTIAPAAAFTGTLSASVTVNDGQNESNVFSLKIEVVKTQNVAPQITGQEALTVNEDETIMIQLGNLKVTDPDNTYPTGFSIKIRDGSNYTVSGTTIRPVENFFGELSVPVIVNDGEKDSAPLDIKIAVTPVNDIPVITGQVPISTNKNTLLTISLDHLTVTDPDNVFPKDFTLSILNGDNYSVAGNIVSPATDFTGTLRVPVVVNDGKVNSLPYNIKIDVVAPTTNVPPVIAGQREVTTKPGSPVTLQLSNLLVNDPDDEYPRGFTLKVSPGADYTVVGTAVTPAASIAAGTFFVTIRVHDGKDDSEPFQLQIKVIAPTAKPRIIAQKELVMPEDSTLRINLTDLVVTDADDVYPNGFTVLVLPSTNAAYSRSGNQITPAPNLNGFIEVRVTVNDGVNTSDEFNLAILVSPVNDPPEFINADTAALAYDPGHDPLPVFETINIRDVDDDHLILAEVGFEGVNYNPVNDQCVLPVGNSTIRSVIDSAGRLFLIGYATLDEYLDALRSIEYNYVLTQDENGNTTEILPGPRTVYLTISDGHLASATIRRKISMDLKIDLDVPNAFTPNGDRQNDTWHIDLVNADRIDGATIRVFDKRGVLVYESANFEKDWDGLFNGQRLPVDTYYYTIDMDLPYAKKRYKGTVTVLY